MNDDHHNLSSDAVSHLMGGGGAGGMGAFSSPGRPFDFGELPSFTTPGRDLMSSFVIETSGGNLKMEGFEDIVIPTPAQAAKVSTGAGGGNADKE